MTEEPADLDPLQPVWAIVHRTATGEVLRIVVTTAGDRWHLAADGCTVTTLQEAPVIPPLPNDAAQLRYVDGQFVWHGVRSMASQRADRWATIKQHRQALDEAPVALRDFALDANSGSRMDLMGALMAMQATGQTSRLWRCADNVMRELSLTDLLTVGTAIAARRQHLIETSDALYQQIEAATDAAALAAITWPNSTT